MTETRKITPCLWFDFNAEEAVGYYLSIFGNARIVNTTHYGAAGPGPAGAVMTMLFEIEGKQFLALNGGPQFPFTPAISLIIECKTQGEIDTFWQKLGEGGKPGQCGWLTDKFGVSWQIVPGVFTEVMRGGDADVIERAMRAILPMKKLDIAEINEAIRPH
jgi:predicted 3-demethylubiquinone-9 3-methyltransferase (glyoxalase superfamily)